MLRSLNCTSPKKLLGFLQTICHKKTLEIHESYNDERYDGRCIQGLILKTFDQDVVLQAHFHILNNLSEVQPYLTIHKCLIKEKFPQINEKILLK